MKIIILPVLLLVLPANVLAQASDLATKTDNRVGIFLGYDFGEMGSNKFQHFGGEIGLTLKNDHVVRFVYLNVKLTEEHLSSGSTRAVDGDNVTGLWYAYDIFYDVPIYQFKNGKGFIFSGLFAGYQDTTHEHKVLDESVRHRTGIVGFDIGFRETDVFDIQGLYFNLSIPFGYNFNILEETMPGAFQKMCYLASGALISNRQIGIDVVPICAINVKFS
ncbi:MAG: hypothetical protein AB8B97_12680 [Granulosicoccus sp.]